MLEGVKNLLRKRALKRYASTVPTGFVPIEKIKSAVAFINVEDTSFDECKAAIMSFYRKHGIKGEIFFFDFRKIENEERLITSITTTVLKKDLDWTGRPSKEKINLMLGNDPDLFISLIKGTDYPLEFMAKCSTARFKVGRVQLPGNTFDLVISDPKNKQFSEYEAFDGVRQYLELVH